MKQMLQVIKFAVGAIALCSSAAASSADEGFYLGAGIGMTRLDPDMNGTPYRVDEKYDTGGKLYLGYDLSDKLALEGYYADLGRAAIAPYGQVKYKDLGMDLTYYVYSSQANREGVSAFIRGGFGRMMNKSDLPMELNHDRHVMVGAGLEYGLGDGWSARAALDLFDLDARMLSVSLVKRFARSTSVPEVMPPVVVAPVTAPVQPPPVAEPEPTPVVEAVQIVDSDGDSVPDDRDRCPDTPSWKKVDVEGCEMKVVTILQGVNFASNSAELLAGSSTILDSVAESLKRYPEIHVEVGGHTDSAGSASFNQKLSERRANTVRDYLIAQGVAADHVKAKGYGEESPIADNSSAEGRVQNRRVELKVLDNIE